MLNDPGQFSVDRRTYLLGMAGLAGCSGLPNGDSENPEGSGDETEEDTPGSGNGESTEKESATPISTNQEFSGVANPLSDAVSPEVLDEQDMVAMDEEDLYGGDIHHREFAQMRDSLDGDLEEMVVSTLGQGSIAGRLGLSGDDLIDYNGELHMQRLSLNVEEEEIIGGLEDEGVSRQDAGEFPDGWKLYQGEREYLVYNGPVSWAVKDNQAVEAPHSEINAKPVELLKYKAEVIEGESPDRMERPGRFDDQLERAAEIINNDSRAEECVTLNVNPSVNPNNSAYLVRGLALLDDGEYEVRDWDRTDDGSMEYHLDVEPTSIRGSDLFGS